MSCLVLVPVQSHIELAREERLQALERRDYIVRRVCGYAAIDLGRNPMVTDAMREHLDETFWMVVPRYRIYHFLDDMAFKHGR